MNHHWKPISHSRPLPCFGNGLEWRKESLFGQSWEVSGQKLWDWDNHSYKSHRSLLNLCPHRIFCYSLPFLANKQHNVDVDLVDAADLEVTMNLIGRWWIIIISNSQSMKEDAILITFTSRLTQKKRILWLVMCCGEGGSETMLTFTISLFSIYHIAFKFKRKTIKALTNRCT